MLPQNDEYEDDSEDDSGHERFDYDYDDDDNDDRGECLSESDEKESE